MLKALLRITILNDVTAAPILVFILQLVAEKTHQKLYSCDIIKDIHR